MGLAEPTEVSSDKAVIALSFAPGPTRFCRCHPEAPLNTTLPNSGVGRKIELSGTGEERLNCNLAATLCPSHDATALGRSGFSPRAADPELRLERGDTRFKCFLGGARSCRHGLNRVELLTAREVHTPENALELLAQPGFDLAAHAGDGTHRAGRDTGKIIEKPILRLHVSALPL